MPVLVVMAVTNLIMLAVLSIQFGQAAPGIAFIIKRIIRMSKQIAALHAAVAANTTVVGSAVTLLSSLSQQLKDAIAANDEGDDGAALEELSASLEANTAALASAVAANTPQVSGDSSASTPVHPATDLPAAPDEGSKGEAPVAPAEEDPS